MYSKSQEIMDAVSTFHRGTDFLKLKARWESDFDLWRLKPYDAGKGYYSYTSNAPSVIANKGISLLTSAKLIIRIPEDLLTDEERRIASNAERLVYGSLNINDEESFRQPGRRTLRQLKAWYSIIRGSWAERIFVHKRDSGDTFPDVRVWDIYNVAYGTDSKGTDWASHSYKLPKQQARAEFDVVSGQEYADCIDYWDREKNIMIVDGKEIKTIKHGLGYCPVFIFKVGAAPLVWQDNYQYTETTTGESIFAPNRNIFPIVNKTISDLLTLVRRGVKVPIGYWSADGTKTLESDIFQVEKAASVPLKIGEQIAPLLKEAMPANAMDLVNIALGEEQRGAFPHTSYGDVSTRLSGYAINQLNAALSTVIAPFIESVEHSYLMDALEIWGQFTKKDYPAIKVRGRNSRNQAFGYPKAVEIKPGDIKGDWHPEVSLEAVFPKDEPQRVEMARMLREGEVPLLSDRTIRSELLGVQDTDMEDAWIDREWADKQIINRLYDAYIEAVQPGNDPMKATNILAALRQLMAQTSGAPSKTRPAQGAGFSARVLPPETMGGTPPGAQNAVAPPPTGEA
jgi:hypothetical protein